MEVRWIKHTQNRGDLIVVFGGWGVGPHVFAHLEGSEDVLFVQDYRTLDQALPDLSAYERVILMAWSFGVASYGHWQALHDDPFSIKIAVNGTMSPVDRKRGIPPLAMQKTIKSLSLENYQLFLSRVFGAPQPAAQIDVEARRAELVAVDARGAASNMQFDHIWVSSRDEIFPFQNMMRAWEGQNTHVIDAPHMPFDRFQSWKALFA